MALITTSRTHRKNLKTEMAHRLVMLLCICMSLIDGANSQTVESSPQQQVNEFWEYFSTGILVRIAELENPEEAREPLSDGWRFVQENGSNIFACKAAYSIGLHAFKLGHIGLATETFHWTLGVPETNPGDHIMMRHMLAESYKAQGNYEEAISWSKEVIQAEGPPNLQKGLRQVALLRIADLTASSPTASENDRIRAELLFEAGSVSSGSGPVAAFKGPHLRSRMANLKQQEEYEQAKRLGLQFIELNHNDPFSPIIALDLCQLENQIPPIGDLEYWVKYFEERKISDSAGLANLRYSLFNGYIREEAYEKAAQLGAELLKVERKAGDPIPWGAQHKAQS